MMLLTRITMPAMATRRKLQQLSGHVSGLRHTHPPRVYVWRLGMHTAGLTHVMTARSSGRVSWLVYL